MMSSRVGSWWKANYQEPVVVHKGKVGEALGPAAESMAGCMVGRIVRCYIVRIWIHLAWMT